MFKKLLISLLIGVTFLFSLAPISAAKAQTTWYNQTFPGWYVKVFDNTNPNEIFGERYTAAQVQWIVYSVPSLLINLVLDGNTNLGGCIMQPWNGVIDLQLCKDATITTLEGIVSKFKLPKVVPVGSSIGSQILADRPLSGISYVRNLTNKLNPVATVQAAEPGVGANQALYAVAFLWKATRNISFFLFVIVAIVFAFMIMFRVKLSPQVVVSIQTALPKIIITLILVTFSYAIAGLMVDLMYVIMGLFSTLLVGPMSDVNIFGKFSTSTVFNFINGSVLGGIVNDGAITLLIYFVIYLILFAVAWALVLIASAASVSLSSFILDVLLVVFFVILILILIVYIIKVTWVLFKTLAEVYGLVIMGPLMITMGALFPQAGFGSWLKKLFSKLMIFPLTGILILLAYILLFDSMALSFYSIFQNNITFEIWNYVMKVGNGIGIPLTSLEMRGLWGPPMLGNAGGATPIAFMLMSVGLIMMLPKIGTSIESFLAGKGIEGTAIGEALGPVGGLGKTIGGAYQRAGMERFASNYSSENSILAKYLRKLADSKIGQKLKINETLQQMTKHS